MDNETTEASWSYFVLTIGNPSLSLLQSQLSELGADGWELVTSMTTVKTWINMTGNDLVFVFKKPGLGHMPQSVSPSIEQQTYLIQLLKERGFAPESIDWVNGMLRRRGLWTADSIFGISAEWQLLDRDGIEAWLTPTLDVDEP